MLLCIKPSGLPESADRPWNLVLRQHDLAGTDYHFICRLTDEQAQLIIDAGAPRWLYGPPDWSARQRSKDAERARKLRAEADEIERRLAQKEPTDAP